jgi:hypothetical protein
MSDNNSDFDDEEYARHLQELEYNGISTSNTNNHPPPRSINPLMLINMLQHIGSMSHTDSDSDDSDADDSDDISEINNIQLPPYMSIIGGGNLIPQHINNVGGGLINMIQPLQINNNNNTNGSINLPPNVTPEILMGLMAQSSSIDDLRNHINNLEEFMKDVSRGATDEQLSTIKKTIFADLKEKSLNTECPITLSEFKPETPIMYLRCGHLCEYDAGVNWLKINKECPICRDDIFESESEKKNDK